MDDVARRNKEIALQVWGRDLGNEQDIEAPEFREFFDKYYTQDYKNFASAPGKDVGFANMYMVRKAFQELFTDAKFEVGMVGADGDLVFVHGTFSGTHTGLTLYGIPASGTKVSQPQVHILRFRDFKICEHHVVRDDYEMYRQMVPEDQDAGLLQFVDTDKYVVPGEEAKS